MDWELSTRIFGWTTPGSCPMDWELSIFLDTIFKLKIEKIRRLYRSIAKFKSFYMDWELSIFRGFWKKFSDNFGSCPDNSPPGYHIYSIKTEGWYL